MKLSRRNFVKGWAAATAALATGGSVGQPAQAAPGEAPKKPGGREILPMPDIQQPYPSALYGKDLAPQPAKPLRPPEGAPNVVIILIDDMGFGAPSAFGGPINMPTLERVVTEGLTYNRFHTTALCSPTRQAMLTGRNHHSVGMGSITETATTAPGYNSVRPNSAAPIAETLRLNGYNTAAFGKMHQTPVWEVSPSGPFDHWPTGEGFEKFYGFVGAETNQWAPTLFDGTTPVEPPEDPDYHLTPDLVNHAIAWVQAQQALTPDKPFFVYLSFGATHAPHHVPQGVSATSTPASSTRAGMRCARPTLANQKKLGIVPQDAQLTPRSDGIQDWTELTADEKRLATRLMEIYAGFAEHTDDYAGRFLDVLRGDGRAGQHPRHVHRRRQRRQRRGSANGHVQRNAHDQLCAGYGREHIGPPGRPGHRQVLQPLSGGLGACHELPLPVDETDRLALGRHAQRHGRALAQGHQGQGPGAQPVPPRDRHRAHHPRVCRAARAGDGARRDPEADRGRQHGLHLRRRQGARPPRHAVLRDVRQPGHLPPGLERGGAAPQLVRERYTHVG